MCVATAGPRYGKRGPLAGCSRRVQRLRRGCREHLQDHARAVLADFRGQCSCWAVLDRWRRSAAAHPPPAGRWRSGSRRRSAARSRGLARGSSRRSAGGGRRCALVEDGRADRLSRLVESRDDLGLREESDDLDGLGTDVDDAVPVAARGPTGRVGRHRPTPGILALRKSSRVVGAAAVVQEFGWARATTSQSADLGLEVCRATCSFEEP
jgi:hypothetical protein